MSKYAIVRLLGLSMAVMSLGACGDSLGVPQTATIRVLLTDAPADYIGEAFVDIGTVELLSSDGGDRIVLSEDGTDGPVNLLDLQGLATEVLADMEIPVGTYHQLRLFVESASVTLADGYLFNDGSAASVLRVPSGAQTGIKLNLRSGDPDDGDAEGVVIRAGETILVVDFDVSQSFRIQGNPSTPAGIKSVSFRPTLRVVVQDLSGSISGVVSTARTNTPAGGLGVSVTPYREGRIRDSPASSWNFPMTRASFSSPPALSSRADAASTDSDVRVERIRSERSFSFSLVGRKSTMRFP